MTTEQLREIAEGRRTLTKALAVALAKAMIEVIELAAKKDPPGDPILCPHCGTPGGHSFSLGYRTKAIVMSARIEGMEVP